MPKKASKYRMTKEIATSLIDENLESISFFLDKMDNPEYEQIINEYRPHQYYYINKLKKWYECLCEMKDNIDQFIGEEVYQLVI